MDDLFESTAEYEAPIVIDGGDAEPASLVALAVVVVGLYGAVYTVGAIALAVYLGVAAWS